MPEARPGMMHHATATKAVLHGLPCIEEGVPGIAVKQVAAPAGTGLGSTLITQVQVGEKFAIIAKGRVLVNNAVLAAVRGDPIYMTIATNALTKTGPASGTVAKFGRCVEVAGDRGVPTGFCRIDLDMKDSFV